MLSLDPIQSFFKKSRHRALVAAIGTAILLSSMGLWANDVISRQQHTEYRLRVVSDITPYGNALTTAINRRFALLEGLSAFALHEIPSQNGIASNEFEDFAAGLYFGASGIRNISLAPEGVQQIVYPLEGNENVLGHNLIDDERPDVRADVQQAIDSRQIAISGPYELRQGGLGVVARKAIFWEGEFWGLAAMVLDVPPILEEAGIEPAPEGLTLALEIEEGNIFWGEASVLEADPVHYEIVLPDGSWKLWAVPQSGWQAEAKPTLHIARFSALLVVILISCLLYITIHRQESLSFEVEKRTRELAESENLLREVIDNMDKAIAIYEPVGDGQDFVFVSMNEFGERITRYKVEQVLGKTVRELFPGESSIGLIAKLRETWETGRPTTIPLKQYQDERITQWVENYIFKLPSGRVVAMFEDTFEKRKAEMALVESETRLKTFLKNSPDTLYMLDLDNGATKYFNKDQFLGYSAEELTGSQSILDAVHPDDMDKVRDHWNKTISNLTEDAIPIDYRVRSKSGEWVWITQRISPLPAPEGEKPRQILVTLSDITRRKQAEEDLQKLNEQLEERVAERTERLQILVDTMVGREIRMAELKKVIKKLRAQLMEAGLEPSADDPLVQNDRER